jgi:signal transduction histidine kinase
VRELIGRYHLPVEHFLEIIAGCRMDLEGARFETWEDLRGYCHRVASVVGLVSIEIFGYRDAGCRQYALDLGLALQLTNILRDVGQDYTAEGRIYLPREEMERFGVSEDTLKHGRRDAPFLALMQFQTARAWDLYARARAALARLLLAPNEAEDRRRLAEVTRSRARLVAAFEAERRRIERDLHDGAQQRLVSLSMTLGLLRLDAPPELADRLASAHREADQVLVELRELIHGIHPQVLADYGLTDALADAADRSAVPVEVAVDLPRFPESVESAAYFAVREALANIGRHSGAERAWLGGRYEDGRLRVQVRDDGLGGADPSAGTGLTGLADRLAVLDGTLSVHSPAGGPTVLFLEIPCPTR